MAMFKVEAIKDENPSLVSQSGGKSKISSEVISATSFTGEISSVKGLNSNWCYCAKINQLTGEVESPTLNVVGDSYIHIETSK